jgi:hypothetical protein
MASLDRLAKEGRDGQGLCGLAAAILPATGALAAGIFFLFLFAAAVMELDGSVLS